jgi:hypothetical protein
MFPGVNLSGAAQKAQQAIAGTQNNLDGVGATAKNMGLDASAVNQIYQRVGNTPQARMVCKLLGTTPEALKEDADRIVGGHGVSGNSGSRQTAQTRFPRLK